MKSNNLKMLKGEFMNKVLKQINIAFSFRNQKEKILMVLRIFKLLSKQ